MDKNNRPSKWSNVMLLNDAIDTLSKGGKVPLGDLGYLVAESKRCRVYDFSESEEGTTRLRETQKIIKYYPSYALCKALN